MANYNFDTDYEMEENTEDLDIFLDDYQEEQEEQNVQQEEPTSSILDSEATSSSANTDTKKQRSWVWAYFTGEKNGKKARCNICNAYIITNKGSTSGLSRHLKNKHPLSIQKNKNQPTLQETLQNNPIPVSYI
jgi:BED zinc finger